MTAEDHFNKMMEMFGSYIPDPEHHPAKFQFYVTMYKQSQLSSEIQDADTRS